MALSRGRRYEASTTGRASSTLCRPCCSSSSSCSRCSCWRSSSCRAKSPARTTALSKLNRQIEELTNLLALERTQKSADESKVATLTATLDAARAGAAAAARTQAAQGAAAAADAGRASAAPSALDAQKQISAQALAQVDMLNQQIAALRRQLAAIEDALAASEASGKEAQPKIADLGARLNVALAQKVQELARYRSDFFGRLRQILGARPDIRVVGDRFVFESSVLFDVGKADVSPAGQQSLDTLASAVARSRARNPARHSLDPARRRPYRQPAVDRRRPVQVELGAVGRARHRGRAISDLQRASSRDRLAAAGFGEFQPIDQGTDDDSLARNRRIELKLTER